MPRDSLRRSVERGWLHRLHRGVYAVGHRALPTHGRETAALLACGAGAVLSHRSAAAVWRLAEPAEQVEVTVAGTARRSRAGIVVHASRLAPPDVVERHRLRVTAPARTIVDLAAGVETSRLERMIDEVGVQRLASLAEIRAALDRSGARAGAVSLRALLDRLDGPRMLRSEAEARMLVLVRRSRLPVPTTNARVGRHEVDMLWRTERLIVEVDGYAFHSSRQAFERDRVRDAELQSAGYRVLRVTWRQIVDEPEATVARLARLLVVPSLT